MGTQRAFGYPMVFPPSCGIGALMCLSSTYMVSPWTTILPLLSTVKMHCFPLLQPLPTLPSQVPVKGLFYIDTLMLFSCSVVSNSLVTPWTAALQAPLSMGFPKQEYWRRLSFPSLGYLSNPGIEPVSPTWQVDSLLLSR